MPLDPNRNAEYWMNFNLEQDVIEGIFNHLLEKEVPLETNKLVNFVINFEVEKKLNSIQAEKEKLGRIYFPKNEFNIGDKVIFTHLDGQKGEVVKIREGVNPDYKDLRIYEFQLDDGSTKEFPGCIENHPLNEAIDNLEDDPNLDVNFVKNKFGREIFNSIEKTLEENPDLIKIAGKWFPRSLLVDVSIGFLNLAEAVLDESNGGPISTAELIDRVEFDANADRKLLDFSFDLSMQEDKRFDEVGPSGETLWFLHSREPDEVKSTPKFLEYQIGDSTLENVEKYLNQFEGNVFDELDDCGSTDDSFNSISISLIFPHWRSGTLPLSGSLKNLFPTAYEAPRVKFDFVDISDKWH